jgi:DNA-binding transcriptional LysR family regulator
MSPGTPTLDQLRVFLTVVEAKGFAAAARRLSRAPSVISYAITNLEAQLGLRLFERTPTKRPMLTEAGHLIYAEARAVAHTVDGLRARAAGILEGLEAEVSLAVDVLFPTMRLMETLSAFQAKFPTVLLRLNVEALGGVSELLVQRKASLGITGPLTLHLKELEFRNIGSVELLPVSAPSHPLAAVGLVQQSSARDHVQLVLTDRSSLTEGQDFQVTAIRTWRIADLGTKHALLLAGLGWGNMPAPMVEKDIEAGRLVRLNVPQMGGMYDFRVACRLDTPPGPAARWLIQRLIGDATGAANSAHSA